MPSYTKPLPHLLALSAVLAGCGTTALTGEQQQHPVLLSAPVAFGEGDTGKGDTGKPATRPSATAEPSVEQRLDSAPDPQPLSTTEQWQYELRFAQGKITVERVTRRHFDKPVVTARQMGRYAFELWIGRELIDRVRFDFPLLGAETPAGERQSLHEAPRFGPGLEAERMILVPHSERATQALLKDRATGDTIPIPWPPDAPLGPHKPAAQEASDVEGPAPKPSTTE